MHVIDQQDTLALSPETVQKIAQYVVQAEGHHFDEVAIHLVDTATICDLHAQYFDDPSTTDCISFPVDDEESLSYRVMGDVFVCPETAVTYGTEHNHDPYTETTLYIVHGLLHLMGYDDQEDEAEKAMRAAEARHMAGLAKQKLVLKKEGRGAN